MALTEKREIRYRCDGRFWGCGADAEAMRADVELMWGFTGTDAGVMDMRL